MTKQPLYTAVVVAAVFAFAAAPVLITPPAFAASDEPASATGEQQASEEPALTQEEELVVEDSLPYLPKSNTILTKLPLPIEKTPANVGVVPSNLIDEQNAIILGNALENVSGLNVQTGSGVFDYFVIRGFDSLSSALILTDGAPEPEVTFYQLYNAEQVEVLKGPGGFLYGSNPLAGAVNIVRKQPVPTDFGILTGSAGSFDTYEAKLDWNQSNEDGSLAFRLNGLWRESDGYREDRESEVTALNPSFAWRPNVDTSLVLNLEMASSDFHPDAGLPLIDGQLAPVNRRQSYASPFDTSEQDLGRIQLDYERRLSDRTTIRNKTYYRGLDWVTNGTLLNGVFPDGFGGQIVARSLILLDDEQEFWGNQFEVVLERGSDRVRHNLLAGVELSSFQDTFTFDVAALPVIGLENPIETAMQPLPPIPGQASAGDATSMVIAPYLLDQISFGERLDVLLGARFDTIDFDDDVSGASRSDSEISPMLGATYAIRPDLSVYTHYSRSFAPPSARAAGDLVPEESNEVELGLRFHPEGGRFRGTITLFELERENIAIPDDNGFTQQVGDQRARGLEIDLGGSLGSGVNLTAVYAYTDSELTRFSELVTLPTFPPMQLVFDRSGNQSAFSPEHLLNVWIDKKFESGLMVAGGLRFVDDQFISEDNSATIDSHMLLNGTISYTLGSWRLNLFLRNLTDEDYETRGFGSFSVIPGDPFSATLGADFRF